MDLGLLSGYKTRPVGERLTDVYILLMLLVFPLITGFEGYRNITLSKYAVFVGLTGLWLLLLAAAAIAGRCEKRRLRAVHIAVIVFMAICCLSAAVSPWRMQTLLGAGRYDGLVTLLLYGGIFLGVSLTCRPKRLYLYALGMSTLLCCAVAFFQLLGKNPLDLFPNGWTYYDSGVEYTGAFLGTVGNTNLLSGFLCLSIPLLTVSALREPKNDWPLLIPAAAGLGVLLASGVAGGVVGILVCALVAAPVLMKKHRRIVLPIGIGVMLVGLAVLWLWPGDSGTVWELSELLHGRIDDSFGSSRVLIWRETLRLVPERWLLGGGPDTLPLRLDVSFSRYVEETGRTLSVYVDNAHNEYLGYLVNVGVLGPAAYLAAMAMTLLRWLRGGGRFTPAVGCALVCYWVQALFGLGLCLVLPLMWLLWGVLESELWPRLTESPQSADF